MRRLARQALYLATALPGTAFLVAGILLWAAADQLEREVPPREAPRDPRAYD